MKNRTQLLLGAAIFGVVLLVLAASMVTTTAELGRLEHQVRDADRIGSGRTPKALTTIENLKKILEMYLRGRCAIGVVDLADTGTVPAGPGLRSAT